MDVLNEIQVFDQIEEIFEEWDESQDQDEEVFHNRVPKRYIRNAQDPLNFFNEHQFRERYRFSKDVVMHYLLPLVIDELEKANNRGLPVSPHLQLIIFLRYCATASFQKVLGDVRGFSQASVCLCIHRVSRAFARLLHDFVKFPSSRREQFYNIQKFFEIAGMPNVQALIDGCLIPIPCPGKNIGEIFRCRKGFYAINLLVVIGPNGEMYYVDARHPGNVHDQTAAERSALSIIFRNQVIGSLLGDNGYGNETWLMTPFVKATTPAQQRYNKSHILTRNKIEKTFGMWKRKFPCLKRLLTKLDNSIPIICACAVLWNIHISLKYNNQDEIRNFRLDPRAFSQRDDNMTGLQYRSVFVARHFA